MIYLFIYYLLLLKRLMRKKMHFFTFSIIYIASKNFLYFNIWRHLKKLRSERLFAVFLMS